MRWACRSHMELKLVQKSPLEKQSYTMLLFLVLNDISHIINFAAPIIIIFKGEHTESTYHIVPGNCTLPFLRLDKNQAIDFLRSQTHFYHQLLIEWYLNRCSDRSPKSPFIATTSWMSFIDLSSLVYWEPSTASFDEVQRKSNWEIQAEHFSILIDDTLFITWPVNHQGKFRIFLLLLLKCF